MKLSIELLILIIAAAYAAGYLTCYGFGKAKSKFQTLERNADESAESYMERLQKAGQTIGSKIEEVKKDLNKL